jgi:homoserine O-acetyltransferase
MGGMHTWLWGVMYPDMMRHLVPLASMPMEIAGRNWMTRRMLIETIQRDPEWNGGNYTRQPASLKLAQVFFSVATSGGNLGLHQGGPTREKADRWVDQQLAAPTTADANDLIYQFDASRGYNPAPQLDRIRARVLAINSLDDERNPPELAEVMEDEVKRVRAMGIYLIPSSPDTRGHGTTGQAKWWKRQLQSFLTAEAERR